MMLSVRKHGSNLPPWALRSERLAPITAGRRPARSGESLAYPGAMVETPGAPQGDCGGGGMTIASYAAARGISKDAARCLLRAGKLGAHRTLGPYGPAWCVHPEDPWCQGSE